jgi:hypothetical protein
LSTSWGCLQVMGAEHAKAGYDDVDKMITDFKVHEFYQVKGGLNFMKNKSGIWKGKRVWCLEELKKKNFAACGYLFNGANYDKADPPYDIRIANAYSKLSKKPIQKIV